MPAPAATTAPAKPNSKPPGPPPWSTCTQSAPHYEPEPPNRCRAGNERTVGQTDQHHQIPDAPEPDRQRNGLDHAATPEPAPHKSHFFSSLRRIRIVGAEGA